ncbi:hypothetical protein BM1_10186 [Bipolaris maydis]|nr:hypothetical protein BM1_10186 [Bipolaris maydis]
MATSAPDTKASTLPLKRPSAPGSLSRTHTGTYMLYRPIHPPIHPFTPTLSPTLPHHQRQPHRFRPTRRACFGPDRPSHAVPGLCPPVALPALNTSLNPPLALVDPLPTLDPPAGQLHLFNPLPSPRYLPLLPQTSPWPP